MSIFLNWFKNTPHKTSPLFETKGLEVLTFDKQRKDGSIMRKLKRSTMFESDMIDIVENGIQYKEWEGFVYIMHFDKDIPIPLYIGKAEKKGVTQEISFNINNIRKNKHAFGRWGDGLAYHIGDLSHAIYRETAYKKPSKKYERWASAIFDTVIPPTLKKPVYISLFSWYNGMKGPSQLSGTVPSVEKELISIIGDEYHKSLLNVDGK